jgi:membrane peptidoglycan carboxypeptidase
MGINSWKDASNYGLSLTLGGGEVKPIELVQAYSILANLGYRIRINGILQVSSYTGEINYQPQIRKEKILDEGIAYILSDILSDNFARQWDFGPRSFLEVNGYKVAVKTGTTDNKKDNWTVGYNPEFLVLVWVGNNDGSPMNPYLTSGITGAAPIWNRIMTYLLKNYGQGSWYEKPENVVEKKCYFGRNEYFIKGTENSVNCFVDFKPTPTQ